MTPQELKNSILQLAIQGKLVEQRPEEGTAEELYRQIQEEKQKLIAEGKIKKEKPYSTNTSYKDFPFEIPDSWTFVRFGELMISRDSERIPVSTGERSHRKKIYDYYGASGVIDKIDDYLFNKDLLLIGEDGANLLNRSTPIAFIASGKYWVNNHAHVLDACCNLSLQYICYFINAISLAPYVTGTAQPKMNQENMNAIWVPLPPLAEQQRIVAKIEELLPLIDRYEKAWNRLEEFNKQFPGDLQKSILQMAIQGKLVEQRPVEGTGEELYQQIQAEKQKLIAEGKIKKEKPLPEITEEEKPYDIPASWLWTRFGDLGNYKKGPFGSALTKSMFVPKSDQSVKVYEQKNAIQKDASLGEYYIHREYFESAMSGFEVRPGDVIVSCAGTIGETYVLPDSIEQGIINQALMRMRIFAPMYIPYFLVFFDVVLKQNARTGSKGSAIKNIPPFEVLKNYLVPLPPFDEQKRIVARLEELLPLCEALKS